MSNVTISGGAGVTLDLRFSSGPDAKLARTLAETIDKAIADGGMVASTNVTHAPQPPAGLVGEVVRTLPGTTFLNAADTAAVVTASRAVLVDGGAQGQTVLSGAGSLTYVAAGGSGQIVAGGTLDFVGDGGGNWAINAGGGNDTVSTGSGNDTVGLGGGGNVVLLGSGNSVVRFAGMAARPGEGRDGGDAHGPFDGMRFARGGRDGAWRNGGGDHMHRASDGNETLHGSLGAQNEVYVGSGNATIAAGAGQTVAIFVNGTAGGADVLQNFLPSTGARVVLDGYGRHAVSDALATQQTVGGSTTVTLSDNTTITFTNVSHLNRSFFS